ncbi:unannotated protein [freshwater metagenome]|uniref:Unannotated protein n=1 Tax=freshwater metagenome TaxID=449393 RepID=A0A6J7QYC2_9ZZZZ
MAATSCGSPRKAGPHSPGSNSIEITCGNAVNNWAGCMMRSQKRTTGRNASFTVVAGAPKCSTCCSTGSGRREAKVSPAMINIGSRFAMPTPAAVTKLVAPGPIDEVHTITCWRRIALANAAAARPMPSSLCPRHTGSSSRCISSACPRLVTLPCPKIAKTPGKSGTSVPSTTMRCEMR